MPDKDELAHKVAEILKDDTMSAEERLDKMKNVLPNSHKNSDDQDKQDTAEPEDKNTYDSQALKLAAIKKKMGIKKAK